MDYDKGPIGLDYRDSETLELHLPDGSYIEFSKSDVQELLEGFDQEDEE